MKVPKPPKIKNHTRVLTQKHSELPPYANKDGSVWQTVKNYLKKIKKDREDWIDELKHSESGFATKRRKPRK